MGYDLISVLLKAQPPSKTSLLVVVAAIQYCVPAVSGMPALSVPTSSVQHAPYVGAEVIWKDLRGLPGRPALSSRMLSSNAPVTPLNIPTDASILFTVAAAVGVNGMATHVVKGKPFDPSWAMVFPKQQ